MSNDRDPQRAWILRGLLAYLAFVVYGSLVPLNFRPMAWADAAAKFAAVPFLDLGIGSRADWVANLLLFVPLAFLAAQALPAAMQHRWPARLLLWGMATALAFGIEFTQVFFPGRTVSQNDILAESLGAGLGLGAQAVWGATFARWLAQTARAQRGTSRLQRVLTLYLALLCAFSVLPLDLTISPVEIYHKWREGRVVWLPFALQHGAWVDWVYEWVTDAVVWAPPGALMFMQRRSLSSATLRTLGLALAFEVLQLFVWSRTTDITDVLLAGLGGWCGASLISFWREPAWAERPPLRAPVLAALSLVWVCTVLVVFWFPFDFSAERMTATRFAESFGRVPLSTYYFRSEFGATNELLRKVLLFMPGGAALAALHAASQHRGWSSRGRWPALVLLTMAALVESGQVLLPGKVADLTDLVLEFGGGLLGVWAMRWIWAAPVPAMAQGPEAVGELPVANGIRAADRPPMVRGSAVGRSAPTWVLGTVLFGAALIYLLARMPGIPYNVTKLVPSGAVGLVASLGLSGALGWVLAVPAFGWVERNRWGLLLHPVVWSVHGLVAYALLRSSVPLEMIHKIIGTPVWGWPWHWEDLLRYAALHGAIVMQVAGGALAVRVLLGQASLADGILWWLVALVWAWPLYLVVCQWAGTDNLVELLRDGASFWAASAAAGGVWAFCLAASAVAALVAGCRHRARLSVTVVTAAMLSVVLLWVAQEPVIVKYGRVFSAWQFVVSPSRESYADGWQLGMRLSTAFGLVLIAVVMLQHPIWRRAVKR